MKSSKKLITIATAGLLSISALSVLADSTTVKLGGGSGVMSTVGSCPLTPKMVVFYLHRKVLTRAKSLPACAPQYMVTCSIKPNVYSGSVNIQTGSSPRWNFDLSHEVPTYKVSPVATDSSSELRIVAQWYPHNAVKQKNAIFVACRYAPIH